jgi:hypothetical protein
MRGSLRYLASDSWSACDLFGYDPGNVKVGKQGAVFVAVAMLLVAGGCKRSPATIVVTRLLLNFPAELDGDRDLRDGVRGDIIATLTADSTTRYKPEEREGTHTLRVEIASPVRDDARNHHPDDNAEADEAPMQRVRVELRPRPDALSYDVIGRAPATSEVRHDAVAAFQDAWAVIVSMRLLDRGDESDLIGTLKSSDERLQLFAVQRLGDRKTKAAVVPLIALLDEKTKPELALRAIGALIAIGDPRAAEPMIELAHNKDPQFVLQVVFALGSLGGPTAEGYLVTLASGHPVEAVRRGAEDALAELGRKRR